MTQQPTDTAAGDPDPVTRQLLQQAQVIARLRRDLDHFANDATDATDTIADLLARFEDLETRTSNSGITPAAWCWRDLGPHAQTELMNQLDDWTGWLRHRYPLARKIPACWAQHPELVEELTALWLAWQGAYQQPDAPLTAAADWARPLATRPAPPARTRPLRPRLLRGPFRTARDRLCPDARRGPAQRFPSRP
jgi:hypothetical protein